ncbi:MAG TPA: fasciclin domain-containing protein [Draconibacterium sp.]|nr:fasciclin domain-containing protein [Draconibacterium sp.]
MKKMNLNGMMSLRSFALAGILALSVFAVSCSNDDGYIPTPAEESELKAGKAVKKGSMTIADIVRADDGEFDVLQSLLESQGLMGVFEGTDQYTVFAPTDAAFEALFAYLNENSIVLTDEQIVNTLLYHVTDGRRAANSVLPAKNGQMKTIATLLGQTFKVNNTGVIYTSSKGMSSIVTTTPGATFNISASNGIIHVISAVLVPEL